MAIAAASLFAVSCNNSGESMDFERMVNQARYQDYQAAPYFDDGRAMRTPPEGVVPTMRVLADPRIRTGLAEDGSFVAKNPIRATRELLELGRARFEVFCAPCHGIEGDGQSVVARKMDLRSPPSLVSAPIAAYPEGRVYEAIAEGYGLMPSYGRQLSVDERWAVVAYVRALGIRNAGIPVNALPEPIRARAQKELR